MNYLKIYNNLIQKRRINPIIKEQQYCESHHIQPRCMNGSDDKFNIINLTLREHYIAHLLLCKIYPQSLGLNLAVELMCKYSKFNNERQYLKFNSKLYEAIRIHNIQLRSKYQSSLRWICNKKLNKQTYWPKNEKLSDAMIITGWEFGRLKNKSYYMSDETKQKWINNIRNTKRKFSDEKKANIIQKTNASKQIAIMNRSPQKQKEVSTNISNANKRRWKNISKQKKNEMYQKVRNTSKITWKNKSYDEMKAFSEHQSLVNKGRIWITNLVTMKTKHIYPNELDSYLCLGWVKGRILHK